MKKVIIILAILAAMLAPAVIIGCEDKIETHQERTLAPRTVQQSEVVTP